MLVLGRCIREIRKVNRGEAAQVPFRESKLTELFRDFFEPGGRSTMAAIIINISPSTAQFDDSLFSLQFAAEAVECTVRTGDDSDDSIVHAIDFASDDENYSLVEAEAKIRQEVREEMTQRVQKLQSDMQSQVEQIRAQSGQPYTSKLQQALAQRMQKETRSRELDECARERDREKARADELEKMLRDLQEELSATRNRLDEIVERNMGLEGNIAKMIDTTKKLHERHVQLQVDLQNKADEMEAFWKKRVTFLEGEIERLKK
jgi:chromosome segregation ATPase